jgi:hypothetical protein
MQEKDFNDTTLGLLKAMHLRISEPQRRAQRAQSTNRFTYESNGTALHARRCLRKSERDAINAIIYQLRDLQDQDLKKNVTAIRKLLDELHRHPVSFVPVKREIRIDRSKNASPEYRKPNILKKFRRAA